jgi:hypothetical protein
MQIEKKPWLTQEQISDLLIAAFLSEVEKRYWTVVWYLLADEIWRICYWPYHFQNLENKFISKLRISKETALNAYNTIIKEKWTGQEYKINELHFANLYFELLLINDIVIKDRITNIPINSEERKLSYLQYIQSMIDWE